MPTSTATRENILLTCSPERVEETIVFSYSVANQGRVPAYVTDAMPLIDPVARTVAPDPDAVTVWRGADGFAHVLKGVAPLPTDRLVPGRVLPLMVRLAPGEAVERRLVLALPLAEHSPYFSLGNLRNYRLSEIEGITLAIDAIVDRPPGLTVAEVRYAPGLFEVSAREITGQAVRLTCAFPARGLHLMMRTDGYPRPE